VLQTFCETFGFAYGARWIVDRQNLLLRCAEMWCDDDDLLRAFAEHSRSRVERPGRGVGLNRKVWSTGAAAWIADLARDRSLARRDAALAADLRSAFAFPLTVGGEFYGVMEFFAREPREPGEVILTAAQTISGHI